MLKENERLYFNVLALFDVIITIIAFVLGYYIKVFIQSKSILFSNQYLIIGLLIIPIWYILLKITNLQSSQKIKAYSIVIIEYAIVIIIGISILFIFIFWLKFEFISRVAIFIFAITDLLLLSVTRILLFSIQKRKTIKGKSIKNILIYADNSSIQFINKIISSKQWGYKIFAIITDSNEIKSKFGNKFEIFDVDTKIDKIIEQKSIDEVIFCKNDFNKDEIRDLIYSCEEIGVDFQIQSDFFSMIASKSHLNYLGETPVLSISSTSTDYFALTIKNTIDFIVSFITLLFTFPFLILIGILIKLESKGPVFFKQKRVGLRGRMFTMFKFRTMVANAEKMKKDLEKLNEVDGPVFKIKKDPRITKIGAFLRKTSLDEFPQFINVLKGDMSIVGARPPLQEEVDQYERWQRRRLSMKPGITCIWQVSGRNNISFEDWMKMDLQYIDNWSLRLDVILIFKTISTVFKRTGY